jgi:hypothetical protein
MLKNRVLPNRRWGFELHLEIRLHLMARREIGKKASVMDAFEAGLWTNRGPKVR